MKRIIEKLEKKAKCRIDIFASWLLVLGIMITLCSCGTVGSVSIDYGDAESFEAALNEGENLEGKVVQFTVLELHPDSAFGYNLWSGEHLNFVSSRNPDIKAGETVVVKATEITSSMGSWIIKYEKVNNARVTDATVFANGATTDSQSDKQVDSSGDSTERESNGYETFTIGGLNFEKPKYFEIDPSLDTRFYAEKGHGVTFVLFQSDHFSYTDNEFEEALIDWEEGAREGMGDDIDSYMSGKINRGELECGLPYAFVEMSYSMNVESGYAIDFRTYLYAINNTDTGDFVQVMLVESQESEYEYVDVFNKMVKTCSMESGNALTHSYDDSSNASTSEKKSGLSSDFKKTMDDYEEWFNHYCDVMKKYKNNPSDLSVLSEYYSLVSELSDMQENLDNMDQSEMTKEELDYYIEVTARIEKKLLDVAY